MPIHTTINERSLRRAFKEHKPGTRGLAVHDIDLPTFGFRVFPNGSKTFFVRASRQFGAANIAGTRPRWRPMTSPCAVALCLPSGGSGSTP